MCVELTDETHFVAVQELNQLRVAESRRKYPDDRLRRLRDVFYGNSIQLLVEPRYKLCMIELWRSVQQVGVVQDNAQFAAVLKFKDSDVAVG